MQGKIKFKKWGIFSLIFITLFFLMPYIVFYFQHRPSDRYASLSSAIKRMYFLHLESNWDSLAGHFVASRHNADRDFYYFLIKGHSGTCLIGYVEFRKQNESFRIYFGVDLHTNMVIIMNEKQEETRYYSGIFRDNFTIDELIVFLCDAETEDMPVAF